METKELNNGRVEISTDAAHVIRKKGDNNPTDVRRRRVAADELNQWEEITVEEAESAKRSAENETSYRHKVNERIRRRYDLDAELAILRQRDTKPEEFAEYSAYAELCKAEARAEVDAQSSIDDAQLSDESDVADVADVSEEGVGDE